MPKELLRLGTRRSHLAQAQSLQVARSLERVHPGLQIQLVGIDTRGDQIQDVPLQAVEGQGFFSAEIDRALIAGEIDLAVHSYKDLSLQRPPELVCAAVPKRQDPRDVAIFAPDLSSRAQLRVGTSSPRRLENLPRFLEKALPPDLAALRLQWRSLRGNVTTRLQHLREPVDSERALECVVLALAGLIRLWEDESSRKILAPLLEGARWMVLPLSENPTAPAQGALSVECRASDERLRSRISRIHDEATARQIEQEREILREWGGGCHLKLGATSVSHPELGDLLWVKGKKPDGSLVERLKWSRPEGFSPRSAGSAWDGSLHSLVPRALSQDPQSAAKAVFLAHSRALSMLQEPEEFSPSRIWTSGVKSWFKLAERGVWVEGCAEGLGFEWIRPLLESTAVSMMGLPLLNEWAVFTHQEAVGGWRKSGVGEVHASYRLEDQPGVFPALKEAVDCYWSSGSQFEALRAQAPAGARHACGPGKTAEVIRSHGLKAWVFPSAEEWRKWLKSSSGD